MDGTPLTPPRLDRLGGHVIGYFGFPAPVMTPEATRATVNAADLVEPEQPRVQVPAVVPVERGDFLDRSKLTTAAYRARKAFPGPVGDLVARELTEWSEFGWRLGGESRIAQLAAAIMAIPYDELPPAA